MAEKGNFNQLKFPFLSIKERSMLKKLLGLLLAAICVIALGGCMSDAPQSGDGYTVTDARGKTLHMKEKPKRIISTYIFADEILLDLV